jgi:hypothetical protein
VNDDDADVAVAAVAQGLTQGLLDLGARGVAHLDTVADDLRVEALAAELGGYRVGRPRSEEEP